MIALNENLFKMTTPRERQIVEDLADGMSSKEIAQKRGIAFATIETHRRNLLKKTGFRTSAGLVAAFIRGGIV